jgi:hypothetical protein
MLVERVKSKSIRAIGYQPRSGRLWVEFHSRAGGYIYFRVPHGVFDELTEADSIGRYVNYRIVPFYRCEYRPRPPRATRAHSS